MHLSIVVPAFNEEKLITATLNKLDTYLSKQHYQSEIIVVDDGSTDNTLFLVSKFIRGKNNFSLLKNYSNEGKGAAVQKGVLNSRGDFVLFTDADLSAPIEEVERLLYWLYQDFDIVIGSRNVYEPCIVTDVMIQRKLAENLFNMAVKFLTTLKFKDTQCGFKAFSGDVARKLFSCQKYKGFSFDVEILYLAVKHELKIKELAVNWKQESSKVKIIKDSISMLKDTRKLKEVHRNTFISDLKETERQKLLV